MKLCLLGAFLAGAIWATGAYTAVAHALTPLLHAMGAHVSP